MSLNTFPQIFMSPPNILVTANIINSETTDVVYSIGFWITAEDTTGSNISTLVYPFAGRPAGSLISWSTMVGGLFGSQNDFLSAVKTMLLTADTLDPGTEIDPDSVTFTQYGDSETTDVTP